MKRVYLLLAMAVLCLAAATAFAQQPAEVNATATVDGMPNDTIDFGFIRTFFIGNFVWEDDGDGIQSEEERLTKGISGVVVILLRDGIEIKRTITNETGYYYFRGIRNGVYEVKIPMDQPALDGMVNTTPNVPPYDTVDSDGIPIP